MTRRRRSRSGRRAGRLTLRGREGGPPVAPRGRRLPRAARGEQTEAEAARRARRAGARNVHRSDLRVDGTGWRTGTIGQDRRRTGAARRPRLAPYIPRRTARRARRAAPRSAGSRSDDATSAAHAPRARRRLRRGAAGRAPSDAVDGVSAPAPAGFDRAPRSAPRARTSRLIRRNTRTRRGTSFSWRATRLGFRRDPASRRGSSSGAGARELRRAGCARRARRAASARHGAMDVVGATRRRDTPPFEPTERDGFLHGAGRRRQGDARGDGRPFEQLARRRESLTRDVFLLATAGGRRPERRHRLGAD